MMSWLHKRGETYIEAFDFKKLPKVDTGDEKNRRNTFTEEEIKVIKTKLDEFIDEGKKDLSLYGNLNKVITAYYLHIAIITGLRRGEQLQLRWSDVQWMEKQVKGDEQGIPYSLVKITIRGATTKVRKTRSFVVKDWEYFDSLFTFLQARYVKANKDNKKATPFAKTLIFSTNGVTPITPRVILYHFDEALTASEIENRDARDLVPYSFRHYFITDMINKGATPTQVAETCGTSTAQIEKTYYHTSEAKMIVNALPQFEYRDGLLIPK
jgi:integrase